MNRKFDSGTEAAIEQTVRESYGRLLAFLGSRCRDLALIEDVLAEAFLKACEVWPRDGVPDNPEAWMLVVARRKLIDVLKRSSKETSNYEDLNWLKTGNVNDSDQTLNEFVIPDERLKLLFLCAHPAIDAGARTALMLQTVLRLPAERIASAFLVSPATMSQRLVRAKRKIRDAGMSFELPDNEDFEQRLSRVLEAIYAAYGTGWDDDRTPTNQSTGLTSEAIWLGRALVELIPEAAEPKGLLALMLHCEARKQARYGLKGEYVPLSEQRTELWNQDFIREAEQLLTTAIAAQQLGPFQLEAAIQSVHNARLVTGETNWRMILTLYDRLLALAPTVGAHLGQIAALRHVHGAETALRELERLPRERVQNHQPYWALKADLLANTNSKAEAEAAFQRAIGLCESPRVREYLRTHMRGL